MTDVDTYSRLAGVYDEIVVDPCYDRWASFLHELWQAEEADAVTAVLDVCCGTGLMAQQLIARGYRVVGVDGSAMMLSRARGLLGPDAVLLQQTLPDLAVDAIFDAAISTFDGLNYLTPAQLSATFDALSGRLRGGGWLIFDVHTDTMMEFAAVNPVVDGSSHGHDFSIVNEVDVGERTCDTKIEVTRTADGDAFTEHHRQYFFTEPQIRAALEKAGFAILAVTEEYSHRPADATTLRATWAARRSDRRAAAEMDQRKRP